MKIPIQTVPSVEASVNFPRGSSSPTWCPRMMRQPWTGCTKNRWSQLALSDGSTNQPVSSWRYILYIEYIYIHTHLYICISVYMYIYIYYIYIYIFRCKDSSYTYTKQLSSLASKLGPSPETNCGPVGTLEHADGTRGNGGLERDRWGELSICLRLSMGDFGPGMRLAWPAQVGKGPLCAKKESWWFCFGQSKYGSSKF